MARPVTFTMIVKDGAGSLHNCLASVADLVQELIVVDTGSSDNTREIALGHGATVIDFAWRDDFAAARNEALLHASSPWIFWMDADERLDQANRQQLRTLFDSLDDTNAGYVMSCVSYRDAHAKSAGVTDYLRLFRNLPKIRWRNRVHEQIRAPIVQSGGVIRETNIVIQHDGYRDPATVRRKAERNLRLLLQQDAEEPNNPFVLFNIGRSLRLLDRKPEAVDCWRRALSLAPRDAPYLRKLYNLLVEGHVAINQKPQALHFALQGRTLFPDDVELLFHEGTLRIELGDPSAGELAMRRILEMTAGDYVNHEEPELRSKARHNLAVLYRGSGRAGEAEQQLREVLKEQPGYLPAWYGLGCILLDQGQRMEVEAIAQHLDQSPAGTPQAAALRARMDQARAGRS